MDVEQMAEGLDFGTTPPDFDGIRDRVETLVEQGEVDKIRLALEECLEYDDSVRSGEENAWIYTQLGAVYRELDRVDDAIDAYERAFELDPRDRSLALTLSELLTEQKRYDAGLEVARVLLLNHKQKMDDEEIAEIYRKMGELQEGREEFSEARVAFEKSLVKVPEDPMALTGLLRVVGQVGEPGDVVEARLKLIRSLDDARARSTALIALGNDWVEKFNDPGRALDTLEEAVMEWPQNERAVVRIAEVAAELGDWRRACRAYFTLSMLADDPAEKADYLIKSSDVARRELWEPEKALAGYRKALEWDATRLDAFKAVTSILVDARDWENLEEAYVQVISANQEAETTDSQLLGVLWQKLGDLYGDHLERFDDAVFAYGQAIDHLPNRGDLRRRFVDLAEDKEEHLDQAAVQLRKLINQEPENPEWIDRLGRVYLRKKAVDRAYCMFRALRARGATLDGKAAGFLERFDSKLVRPIERKINPSLMSRYIFANGMSSTMNECFSILKTGLQDWTGESRRKYGLSRRDKVKLSEPLAFVNFYKSVGSALGFVDLPELWRKEDQVGFVNGALVPQGFLVGDQMLGSGQEKQIAFVVAKQLFLFLDPFYLATIRPMSDLQGFFLRGLALVQDGGDLAEQFRKDTAYKAMRKQIKGMDRQRLKECIDQLTGTTGEVDLGPWIEAIEDTANRMGLLFCDDLEVAKQCIRTEPHTISQRSTAERIKALIDYSLSEKYLSVRPELGIQVA